MKLICQRVLSASVKVSNEIAGKIKNGLLVYVGFHNNDTEKEAAFLAKKIQSLRIFEDENEKLNLSVSDVSGEILLVPNFTLYGELKKGNRPDFLNSLGFDKAKVLFDFFVSESKKYSVPIKTGIFGADMKVSSIGDGPINIILDTERMNVS